jgi:hypothetical protein
VQPWYGSHASAVQVQGRPAAARRRSSRRRSRRATSGVTGAGLDGTTRVGRPTRLTPRLAKALVKVIGQTGRIEPAARRCGVPHQTVNDWVERGQGRHPTRPATRPFAEFAAAVEKALGQYECEQLAGIQAAAAAKPENWTARAWQLERWDPARYGRRTAVEHSGTITVTEVRGLLVAIIDVLERYVPAERRETELANLLAHADAADQSNRDEPARSRLLTSCRKLARQGHHAELDSAGA